MNRRRFLQSLAAIGTAIAIPKFATGKATTAEIDAAWQELTSAPQTFYVARSGAISSSFGPDWPTSRRVLLGLEAPPVEPVALLAYIESDQRIEIEIENLFQEFADAGDVGAATDWRMWLATGDRQVLRYISGEIDCWLFEAPDSSDWETADLTGCSGRGDALQFFSQEKETAEIFNIKIIYGCHPGSTYYAAELQIGIGEANDLAEQRGLPIRFEYDDEDV